MPYPASDEPLTKVTINLYTKDVDYLQRKFGRDWADKVRQELRMFIRIEQEMEDE
jgi:hypothetical protein